MLLATWGTKAQTWQDTIAMQYDSLQPYVHTGYLYDRLYWSRYVDSGYAANPKKFDGSNAADDLTYTVFYKLVEDFKRAAYDSALLPHRQQLQNIDYAARNTVDVPISVLRLNYQWLQKHSADSGWVRFDTTYHKYMPLPDSTHVKDTIYDSNGQIVAMLDTVRYNNPDSLMHLALAEHKLFAATTLGNAWGIANLGDAITFQIPSNLYFTNDSTPVNLKIDFGDGGGYRSVVAGQSINIVYGTLGRKSINIKFEISGWNNGEYPIAKTHLVVFRKAPPPDDAFQVNDLVINNPCPGLVDGDFGQSPAILGIRYANPTYKKLTRPFILVEGFDSYLRSVDGDYNKYDANTLGYGRLTWNGFMTGGFFDDDGDSVFTQLKQAPLFLDSLNALGYDVMILDLKGNLRGIEANANVLTDVIQWVNQEKETDEELVIIGGSMGGLIARYALRKMELEGCCHHTRLYGTFDTPHDGANIPLGIQEFVYNAKTNLMSKEAGKQYDDILSSRSASQLMVYHREASLEAKHHAFQAVLDSMGHPQDCYRIAISNGNAQGIGLDFGPGDEILHYEFHVDEPICVTAPDPLDIQSNNVPYTLLQNNAFAVANSPNAVSNQLVLQTKPLGNTALNIALAHGIGDANKFALINLGIAMLDFEFIIPNELSLLHAVYTASEWAVRTPFCLKLNTLHNQNNNVLAQNIYLNRPTRPYDYCPGSTTSTTGDITGSQHLKLGQLFGTEIMLGVGLITTQHPNHSFVPTISSLDLPDTTGLYWNFDDQTVVRKNLTPFHSVFIPQHDPFRHEAHVEITEANRQFAIAQIEANRPILHDAGTTLHKTLPTTFNWGHPARVILHNVTIQNGGKMYVNKNIAMDYGNGTSNPNPIHGHFELNTSYCGAVVQIQNGGLLELGENNYQTYPEGIFNNSAEVHFRANSTLEIFDGGTLRINDNSTLFLEPGATLIVHPGATIELAGPDAVLDLQGKVRLEPSANFAPTGSGRVRFAQPMVSSANTAQFWETHPDNSIKIIGAGQQLRAEIVESLYLPQDIDSVVFQGVSATLAPNVGLYLTYPKVRLANSLFVGSDTTQFHNGVRLNGQPAYINGSQFKHGTAGLYNNLTMGASFEMSNCTFTHNQNGVQTRGGIVTISQCTARYNATGWLAQQMIGDCMAYQSILARNTTAGIDFEGTVGSVLTVEECALNNNGVGVNSVKANVLARCSNFNENNVGISAYTNNMVLLHENAQNTFNGCNFGVYLNKCTGIFLNEGFNDFSSCGQYISGELNHLNANPSINVLNNKMPGTGVPFGAVSVPIHVTFLSNQGQQQIPVSNWNPGVTLPQSCAPLPGLANGNNLARDIMQNYISTRVVNTTHFTNVWLHDALAEAAYLVSNGEVVFDDLKAIARFSEILESVSSPFTENENLAINYAAELMVTALSNAVDQEIVPLNNAQEGNPESPYLQLVTEQLNNRISESSLQAEAIFNMSLNLAQTYRMAQHYDYALSVLDSVASPTTGEELMYSEYWECIFIAENALLNEEILPEDFAIEQENCRNTLEQFLKWQNELITGFSEVSSIDSKVALIQSMYPNPATNGVLVRLKNTDYAAQIEVIDVLGKQLKEVHINAFDNDVLIDLRGLAAGVYLLKVTQNNQEQTLRLVVNK